MSKAQKPFWKSLDAAMREEPYRELMNAKFRQCMLELVKTREIRAYVELGLLPPDLPDRKPNEVVFIMAGLLSMLGRHDRKPA